MGWAAKCAEILAKERFPLFIVCATVLGLRLLDGVAIFWAATFFEILRGDKIPLFIVCATVLALLSARNAHVSDRSREVIGRRSILVRRQLALRMRQRRLDPDAHRDNEQQDLNTALEKVSRQIDNLTNQNERFMTRYRRTAWSLIAVAISFLLFFLAVMADQADQTHIFVRLGAGMFVVGFVLLISEFAVGVRTLELNAKSSIWE